ncbi:MAG: amino acid-binding protein [Candidatus Heimdallarchaeota archaeon]|nr:MAG: amino acid-binding protein [Candidatus Heimdallarchaeota archaeon]
MKDISVVLEDKPGTLADLGETLGKANINIEGLCGATCKGEDLIHILVEESGKAYNVLERAGFKIKEEREVLVIDIMEIVRQPGSGGRLFRKLAQEGININLIYLAENNRIVIGVDDLEKAKSVL